MKQRQFFQNVEIFDISTEGKGIGRVNNIVCFIDFAVPGDVVDVEITKKKSNYREGKVIQFQKRSQNPDRLFFNPNPNIRGQVSS